MNLHYDALVLLYPPPPSPFPPSRAPRGTGPGPAPASLCVHCAQRRAGQVHTRAVHADPVSIRAKAKITCATRSALNSDRPQVCTSAPELAPPGSLCAPCAGQGPHRRTRRTEGPSQFSRQNKNHFCNSLRAQQRGRSRQAAWRCIIAWSSHAAVWDRNALGIDS